MNVSLLFNFNEFWHIAGWTMIHYLWLGTLIAAVAFAARLLLRRAGPNARYAVALASLLFLAAAPLGIARWLVQERPLRLSETAGEIIPAADRVVGSAGGQSLVELKNVAPRELEIALDERAESAAPPTLEPFLSTSLQGRRISVDALEHFVPYLPWLWIVGTPVTFTLLAAGIVGTKRLRRASRPIGNGPAAELVRRLAPSVRITRRVTLAVCDCVAAPVLVGIVRPIILLPPAAITGWSPEEIEMVLLHELAHVRRWDNLVNLLQRIIESLVFFHPAVWLVSSWVRREREACCDAVVVHHTQRPHAYAELLVALAAQIPRSVLFHPAASSAMAAGPLRGRIRRILNLEDDPMLISAKSFALMLATLLTSAALAVLYLPTIGQAEESTTEATESTEKNERNLDQQADAEKQHARARTIINMREISLALLTYHDSKGALPPQSQYSDGKPTLSWRVLILPYLGEKELFRQFRLDESWDSDHNRKLLDHMPDVFRDPKTGEQNKTRYLAVVGPECVFQGGPEGIRLQQITDGTSKTIGFVEADEAIDWTKPEDWEFNRQQPTEGLGSLWSGGWYAAFVDGSVRLIQNREEDDAIGIYFTRAGRETGSLKESEGRDSARFDGGEMGMSEGLGMADPPASEADLPHSVPFEEGASRFLDGDNIRVLEVRGTAKTFEPGNIYRIKGTYTLRSRDRAQLSAYTTAREAAEGRSRTWKTQNTLVDGGQGTFELFLPMSVRGWPHVSFYPAESGEGFGGIYFGTGDSVLKKWWSSDESDEQLATSGAAGTSRFPSLEEQKLADLAWSRLGLELEPISDDDLQRVRNEATTAV